MFTFSKAEAVQAAKQFCCALETWTDCFIKQDYEVRVLERDENGAFELDDLTNRRLSNSIFVRNIEQIYDFADTGFWEGQNIFEKPEVLVNELIDPLTELSAFSEIFDRKHINFHDHSGEPLMNVRIADQWMIDILRSVIRMAYARFTLIEGGTLDLEEVAMLANVSLKTVRNAASSKAFNRLVLNDSSLNEKPQVVAIEALRWLENKKGFTGPFIINESYTPGYNTYHSLGQLQHHCISLMRKANREWAELASKSPLNTETAESFEYLAKLKMNRTLSHITPQALYDFGQFCHVENINQFVLEGSKIVASTLAEYEANQLLTNSQEA